MVDSTITGLTEHTDPIVTDLLASVDDPAGSAETKKITLQTILNLFNTVARTITGIMTFGAAGDVGKLKVAGNTSGSTIIDATPVAGSGTVTLPTTGTLATLAGSESLSNKSLVAPALGTPASGVLTTCTGLPIIGGTTGTLSVARGGTGVTTSTGTGNTVLHNNPTLVSPQLGTVTSGVLTGCTGLPLTTGVTGVLPSANMDSDTAHLSTTQTFTGSKTFTPLASFTAGIDVTGDNVDNIQNLIHDISTTTTAINFTGDEMQTISITANTTFTTSASNRVAGRAKTIKILNNGTIHNLTFPAWIFVGSKPTVIAASKTAILTLFSYSTTDAAIVAAYAVEA